MTSYKVLHDSLTWNSWCETVERLVYADCSSTEFGEPFQIQVDLGETAKERDSPANLTPPIHELQICLNMCTRWNPLPMPVSS